METEAQILVLDDDSSIRMAIVTVLMREEWNVESASSAEEALLLCKNTAFDMLVVDKNLPGMSGVDFVREMRKQHSDAACIMITGYASTSSAIEMVHLGLDAYIEKPFDDIFDITRKVEASLSKLKQKRSFAPTGHNYQIRPTQSSPGKFREPSIEIKNSKKSESSKPASNKQLCKILVASSETEDSNWLSGLLEDWGMVNSITSSEKLLELIKVDIPDILILDFNFHGSNVFALLLKLQSLAPKTSFLIIVDKPKFESVKQLIELEIVGVIEKPFDKEAISLKLSELVRITMPPQAPY